MTNVVLAVSDLNVTGPKGPIVTGVSLDIRRGQTLAVVGESGSGKTLTGRALLGLLPAGLSASGILDLEGHRVDLDPTHPAWRTIRGRQIGLVPQDPFTSLSARHQCGIQIAMPLRGQSRSRRRELVAQALDEVGLPQRVARQYPFELSGGMRQRVALAAALITDPAVLIADEPTTALDVTTQAEVLDLIAGLQRDREMGLLLVTHDLAVARARAEQIVVMYAGRIVERGSATAVFHAPQHPYTLGLRECEPPLHTRLARMPVIEGSVPRLADVGNACAFADRCSLVVDACTEAVPTLAETGLGHAAACIRPGLALPTPEVDPSRPDQPSPAGSATHADDTLLVTKGLTKSFGRHTALSGVDLELRRGECIGVVGESGSGKTTLSRILVGLERADSGTLQFRGRPRTGRAGGIQIVFQDPSSALNPGLKIATSLRDALRAGDAPTDTPQDLLTQVGLPAGYARRRPRALSGGEQQRVAIARALAPKPEILICDEPVSALDVSAQAQILNLLAELRGEFGLSMIFISHDLAVVRQVADRIYVMLDGRVVEQGSTAEVLGQPQDPYTQRLLKSVPV
ncbi:ABC transporter ATP-binding protein [Segeticoccus rhizosphaerae]|uniref:ABC transporter ATP-binding protein n=1 Tax=Segeticoccus rhizosphaerae TaxID=1104777 RepID=UPI0010C038EC|nr:ABC transporter ATP-binding protein [Ornithinicoccus soli]